MRQGEECYAGEEADVDEEPGLMTVTWRADVTSGTQSRGADDYARGHSAAESENSGVITFRCDENKKQETLHIAQPNIYDFSSSVARVDESNTNTTSYRSIHSRDQIGPSYETLMQCKVGHRRGMCDCDDTQQVSVSSARHANAGIWRDTGANSNRPDTCGIDVPQYEELLQCIKRQENEIAHLRQAHRQQSNIFIGASKYSHCSNKPPVDSGFHCVPVSSKVRTQARSDLCQCPQKAQAHDFNEN